jgi:hypothetical protein
MRHYTLGDEIRVRITVRHKPNIEEVSAVFSRREAPQTTITLIGSVEDTEELEGSEGSLSTKSSTVVLSSIVDYDHYPGLYTLYSVIFRTVGGQNIRIAALTSRLYDDSEGEAAFWIEEEPTEVDPITAEVEPDPEDYQ